VIAPVGQTFLRHQNFSFPKDSVTITPPMGTVNELDLSTMQVFKQMTFKEIILEGLSHHDYYFLAVAIDENTRPFFADACDFLRSLNPEYNTATNPLSRAKYRDYRIYKSHVNKITGEVSFKLMCDAAQVSQDAFFQHRVRSLDASASSDARIESFRYLAEHTKIKQKTAIIPKFSLKPLKYAQLYCWEQAAALGDIYAALKIGNEMLTLYKEHHQLLSYATAFQFYSFGLEVVTGIKNSGGKSEIDLTNQVYQKAYEILSEAKTETETLEKTRLVFKGLELCLLTPSKDSLWLAVSEKTSLFMHAFSPLLQLTSKVTLCTNLENAVETSRSHSNESLSSSSDTGTADDSLEDIGIESYFYDDPLTKTDSIT
jgi:hypothetical protein